MWERLSIRLSSSQASRDNSFSHGDIDRGWKAARSHDYKIP
jgi:hypothetical protein